MDFFKPTPAWLAWAARTLTGLPVIDIGCGEGLVLDLLREHGVQGAGVDLSEAKILNAYDRYLQPKKGVIMVMAGNAIGHPLLISRPVIGIFCRPCHGTWVQETILAAAKGSTFYVFTRPENEPKILGCGDWNRGDRLEWRRVPELRGVEIGEEGEVAYEVRTLPRTEATGTTGSITWSGHRTTRGGSIPCARTDVTAGPTPSEATASAVRTT